MSSVSSSARSAADAGGPLPSGDPARLRVEGKDQIGDLQEAGRVPLLGIQTYRTVEIAARRAKVTHSECHFARPGERLFVAIADIQGLTEFCEGMGVIRGGQEEVRHSHVKVGVFGELGGELHEGRLGLSFESAGQEKIAELESDVAPRFVRIPRPDAEDGIVKVPHRVGSLPLSCGQARELQVHRPVARLPLPEVEQMSTCFLVAVCRRQGQRQMQAIERIIPRVSQRVAEIFDGDRGFARLQVGFTTGVPFLPQ